MLGREAYLSLPRRIEPTLCDRVLDVVRRDGPISADDVAAKLGLKTFAGKCAVRSAIQSTINNGHVTYDAAFHEPTYIIRKPGKEGTGADQ